MCADKIKHRIYEIITTMNSDNINIAVLKKYIFDGIPDEIQSLRSLAWKLLFNYLPNNCSIWEDHLDSQRQEYSEIKEKYIIKEETDHKNPILFKTKSSNNEINNNIKQNFNNISLENVAKERKDTKESKDDYDLNNESNKSSSNSILSNNNSGNKEDGKHTCKKLKKKITSDHPLSNTDNSIWKNRFLDKDLLAEIDKDVRRTRSHMHFFFMPTNNDIFKNENINNYIDYVEKKRSEVKPLSLSSKYEAHADVLTRILFIYAKINPEVRYIQGMNEVLAPIYYCFSLDQNPYFSQYIEADAYFCFSNLMNKIKDNFLRSKDNTSNGIHSKITNIFRILVSLDKDLSQKFIDQKIEIHYFAFRWVTLLLTQEFEIPDVLRLWDSVLSYDSLFEIISFLSVSIFTLKRQELINADFSGIMESMQSLDKIDVEVLVKTAETLIKEYNLKMKVVQGNSGSGSGFGTSSTSPTSKK